MQMQSRKSSEGKEDLESARNAQSSFAGRKEGKKSSGGKEEIDCAEAVNLGCATGASEFGAREVLPVPCRQICKVFGDGYNRLRRRFAGVMLRVISFGMECAERFLMMSSAISRFNHSVQCNGLLNTVRNKWGSFYNNRIRRWMGAKVEGTTYTLRSKASKFPLHCRLNSSDPYVFYQVFMEHEYAVLKDLKDVRLIIDCGANVGYSAAYFLTLYPEAKLIAIEPDSANFAILERNLKPYGDRVQLHMVGIWSHTTGLTVCRGTYRDGAEWSTQVRASLPGETPDVEAIDIGTLLRESGKAQIDMLKIDIEGSETVVFGENYSEWLGKTRNMAVEIHDEECERIFQAAIAGYPFAISRNENVVVCKTG